MIKFMIIEDDESARLLLKTILKKNFACTVIEAENGEAALNILKSEIPTIILLDITMPVMDGQELLSLLRSNPIFRTIPVVITTAMNTRDIVGSLMEKGVCDYLLKPIDVTETVKRINRVISRMLNKNNGAYQEVQSDENFGSPRLLLVESDLKSRAQFHQLLEDKFIIQDAKNGTETISMFAKFSPRYIVVSDKIGLLDKKIITQKIRETVSEDTVSIYLIASDTKAVSLKVFVFDGMIKKIDNPELFKNEIIKSILGAEAVGAS